MEDRNILDKLRLTVGSGIFNSKEDFVVFDSSKGFVIVKNKKSPIKIIFSLNYI